MQQAGELAKNTSILMNVSEFDDVSKATDTLISSLQAFKKEGQDVGTFSMEIIDKYNEVGNNYAISTSDLAESLTRSSAALVAANNSLEESIAMTTAANTTIQDPESVGNALKVVSMRIRGVKTELEEAGEDTEGMVENTAKLQEKIMALTNIDGKGGIDILTNTGEFKSTYDILLAISKVWKEMDDTSQAALLELVAGKTRGSVVAALFQNGDVLEDAYESASGASGSAMNELNTYLDSIQGRIDLFNNSVQTMWMNFIDSGVVKFIVNLGSGLIKLVDNVGLLETALAGVLTYFNISSKSKLDFASMFGIHDIKDGWFAKIKTQAVEANQSINTLFSTLDKIQNVPLQMSSDIEMASQVDLLNQKWNEGQESFVNYISTLGDADIALKAYAASVKDGNYSLAGFQQFIQQHNAGIKASGVAAKAAAIGHQLLNAAISMGISLLVSAAISAITKWANANEEAAKAAKEAADAAKKLREQADSLEDYKEQIIELRKELDSNTLSESDAYDAREKLLTIQNELIDKFGLEKDGINLVTGAINDQIAAIDELSQKESQQWLNTHQTEINKAIEYFEDPNQGDKLDGWWERMWSGNGIINHNATWNVVDLIDEYADNNKNIISRPSGDREAAELQGAKNTDLFIEFTGSVEEVKTTVEDFMTWLGNQEIEISRKISNLTALPLEEQTDDVKAQIESLKADLVQLQDVREDIGNEYNNWFGDDSTYAANKKIIEETQRHTATTQYSDQYMNILNAENALIEAQANGDEEGIQKALNDINTLTEEASSDARDNGQSYMVDFFNGIKDGYAKMLGRMKFETDLSNNLVWGKNDILVQPLEELKDMNAEEILQFAKIDPENSAIATLDQIARTYGLTLEDLINSLVKLGYVQSGFNEVVDDFDGTAIQTYSSIIESVEAYDGVLQQTSEIISDNTEVTQEYKDSLKELGISEEELNECFYENNGLIVKNAKALNKLVKAANKNVATNVKLAKSNARLEYYDLVKQLDSTLRSTKQLDNATKDSVYTILEQIDAVQTALYQYQLLEDTLLGVNNAFDKFNDAKEIDALNTYGDSYVEMVQTMYDGLFKTGQVGTEQFWAAVESLVPDDVYQGIKEDSDRMKAIYDYYNKNILPSLHLDKDQLSMDYASIENFVQKAIEAKVLEGDRKDFDLVENMNLEEAAKLLGMTQAQVYAFFAELDKYNTSSTEPSFLVQLDKSLEGRINKITGSIEELNKRKLALLEEGDYDKNATAIDEINADIEKNKEELAILGQEAYDMWQAYTKNDAALAALELITNKTRTLTKEEANTLGIKWDAVKGKTVQQAIDYLYSEKLKLEEPTVLTAQLAVEQIDTQIAELEAILKAPMKLTVEAETQGKTPEELKQEIEQQIQALKDDKAVIATTFGIELSDEDKSELEKELDAIEKFTINDKEFTVRANGTSEVMALLQAINDYSKDVTKTVTTKYKTVGGGRGGSHMSSVSQVYMAEADGTAHAQGSWGAPKTETALVGELGPEMLVRNGRWTTVGDNGAEFTQVKKGDIIFNHKQTEDLLSKGYVTGRGKVHGGAFASGTAYSGTWRPTSPGTSQSNNPGNDFSSAGQSLYDAADALKSASDYISDSSDEFKEVFDWIEVRLEKINKDIDLKNAQLENQIGYTDQNDTIDKIIALNQSLGANLVAAKGYYEAYAAKLLDAVDSKYRDLAQNGAIDIDVFKGEIGEKQLEAINEYREWVQKGVDATQQAEEVVSEISSLAKQAIDNIATQFGNEASLRGNEIDQLEAYNALLETTYGAESESVYSRLIEINNKNIEELAKQRDAMQAELNAQVEAGNIEKYSQDWYDAVNDIATLDTEIIELTTDVKELQDSINEIRWYHFDLLMSQFESVSEEADNLIDILSTKDVIDEMGNWTDDGITMLGLYAQQMEIAEAQAKKYADEIAWLKENWQTLGYTEEEYLDKLDELKDGQYDAINAYNDTKDAIVDLNKERIDAIKEGIEKEIEAYEELIETKKEALDAEKDLHDFQKNVMEQQKDIADIERKLAALSGDNSASARAQRAKLEAELYEARSELEETYYDRSISDQQDALDKELEDFQETKEEEIEGWEKYLENIELVVADSLAMVQENTKVVYAMLTALAQQYGLDVTTALTTPWLAGETAIQDYGAKLNVSLTTLAAMFGLTVDEFAAKLGLTTEMLVSNLDITVAQMAENLGLTNEQLAAKLGLTVTDLNSMMGLTIQELAANMGITLPALAEQLGTTTAGLVGNLDMTMSQFAGRMGLTVEDLAGKFGLTAEGLADKLGMTYQDLMNPFGLSMSATVDALTALEEKYKSILDSIQAESETTVDAVNDAMDTYQGNKKDSASGKNNNPSNNSPSGAKSEQDYYGVALAVWNGNYGWGTGKTRKERLTNKGFDADKVQQIINQMGKDGYIHSGAWKGKYHGIKDLTPYHFNKFAIGSTGVKKDQWAILDELGEELQLVPDGNGRLAYIKKGTGIIPADMTKRLMDLAMDPQDMLDRNRPTIGAPHIINNEINIDCSVGTMVNIEHCDQNTLSDVERIVNKAFDKHMQTLNNSLKRFTR